MDKGKVIQAYILDLQKKIDIWSTSIVNTMQRAREAPGFNTSGSDTSKESLSNLALSSESRREDLHIAMTLAKRLETIKLQEILAGALITVYMDDVKKLFFVVPVDGGDGITVDGQLITVVSFKSPLVQKLRTMSVGDTATFVCKELKLVSVE